LRILWLHQYFATPQGWGAVRTYEFARRFVRAGHAVDVVCGAGYDLSLQPAGRAPLTIDGVRVFVSGVPYSPRMGFVRRAVSFLRFMASALWFVLWRGKGYDTVIASSGPLTLAVPALAGRWLWRVPYVFEVIDVWPDSAIAAGVLRNPLLKWLAFRLEALAYRYASAIVTCSHGMTGRVEKKLGFRSEDLGAGRRGEVPVVTISNCCDLETVVPDEAARRTVRERYGAREGQMVVLYAGALGKSNAVEDLAAAAAATADDGRIVWWVAGDGPEKERVGGEREKFGNSGIRECLNEGGNAECRTPNVERRRGEGEENVQRSTFNTQRSRGEGEGRVRWFGRMAKQEVVELYGAADVNVVTFMHAPLFFENSPNKFFDGIAAGLPAVFNRSTWLEPWLKEYACGIVCKGERPGEEMAEALRELADEPARRHRMGQDARRLAEEVFSRDKLAEVYLGILLAATQRPQGRE